MSSINLLSDKMQSRIADFGWYSLTDIQEKTIPLVINSDKHLIVESETASGKTEAVFLPVLSLLEKDKSYVDNVKVLYISPLKALINDQFNRIYKLAEDMNVRITKWHGDVGMNIKKGFLDTPSGILQITPESIEAFMINRPEKLKEVFSGVEYIIIDEIHSFVGKDRGYHLQSLLYRLGKYFNKNPRIFGLSATIDGFDLIKKWISKTPENVEVISGEASSKKTYYSIMHFEKNEEATVNPMMVKDILTLTENNKALIFCNKRVEVESLTYDLNEQLGYKKFYAHHSYIDKSLREDIEQLVKEDASACIVSTSTLELGIDIGSVDLVIQIDNTFTVSSLTQRAGRTGRRGKKDRFIQIYTDEEDALLLAAATIELMKKGIVEMPEITKKNYDYLFQQILSIIVENNGIRAEKLIPEINSNPVFSELSNSSIVLLLKSMISNNYISSVGSSDELILGYAGERMVHNKNFYAMFETMAPYEVICDGKKIGLHDYYKKPNQFVTLAGRSWIVVSTICENRKIYVKPFDGFIGPRFEYHIGEVSELVRNEVFNILINGLIPDYINEWGIDIIKKSEKPYIKMNVSKNQRLFNSRSDVNRLELFISDKKLRSIGLYSLADDNPPCDDLGRLTCPEGFDVNNLKNIEYNSLIEEKISEIVKEEHCSKYFDYLPEELKKEIYLERFCDFEGVSEFLNNINFVKCR